MPKLYCLDCGYPTVRIINYNTAAERLFIKPQNLGITLLYPILHTTLTLALIPNPNPNPNIILILIQNSRMRSRAGHKWGRF